MEPRSAEPVATVASPIPATTEPAVGADVQQPTTSDAVTEAVEPEEPAEEPTESPAPTPRTELEAINPREVSLASGGLQFVEFFAYW